MARPSNPRPAATVPRHRASRKSGAGGTLLGVFIGLVLGLSLAAGVAYYLMKANGPFPAQGGGKDARETVQQGKLAKSDKSDAPADKPRFDFYKILPGVEEPKVQPEARKSPDRAVVGEAKERGAEKAPDAAAEKAGKADKGEKSRSREGRPRRSPLRRPRPRRRPSGSGCRRARSPTESDAENLKARLAFAGWQASVQQGTLPDKGVRYRVRLGPYDNTDELNRIRGDLAKNGFDVAVIKF